MTGNTIEHWIVSRNNEVIAVFDTRKQAVYYLKEMLEQTLKDFAKQDRTNEYDYEITIPELKIFKIKRREAYLGL